MKSNNVCGTKPAILVFTRYYWPGYRAGGPIRTIASMVDRLSGTFDFKVVALDRDLGDTSPYPDVYSYSWIPCGRAMVRYVSPNELGLREITNIVRSTPHDVIYLNSFFDWRFTQQVIVNYRLGRLCGRPIVIASRGEFSMGAMRIKSQKKLVFIKLATLFKLYDGLTWQASSVREAEDIRRVLSVGDRTAGHIVVAPDLVESGDVVGSLVGAMARHRADSSLRACFLSRISRMKNLDYALRVLAQVRVPVLFTIYGPIEDTGYWAECEALIAQLPSNIEVKHEGEVEPTQVAPTLMQNDLFLFPTRGENFGHVIHEALRAGLPLLISDQTPWQRLEEQGVGWDLPLADISAFARRIEEVAGWSDTEYQQRAARACSLAYQVANEPRTVEMNRRLFIDAIGGKTPATDRFIPKGEENA